MNDAPTRLDLPCGEATVRALSAGEAVSLHGLLYTGRDRLHKHLHEGNPPPVPLRDGAIFHCGPVVVPAGDDGWRVLAAGPTTSCREDPYMPGIIARHGVRLILGKGGMGPETLEACRRHGCVYVQVVGGAAAWLARCVRRVGRVWFLETFGATEAMWELEVEGLTGVVALDAHGNNLFAEVEQHSRQRLRELLDNSLNGGSPRCCPRAP